MSIKVSTKLFQTLIDNFKKTVTYTPVTKTTSNLTGQETLTDGTSSTIIGAFFKKEDYYFQDKPGMIKGADAILLVKPDVTINKDDKISYNSENFRVEESEPRYISTTHIYNVVRLFEI